MGNQCFQKANRNRDTVNNQSIRKTPKNFNEIILTTKIQPIHQSSQSNQKQKIKQLKEVTLMTKPSIDLTCKICQQKYNLLNNLPVILCEQQHTICLQCKDMLLSSKIVKYRACPSCKTVVIQHFVRNNQQFIKILRGQ